MILQRAVETLTRTNLLFNDFGFGGSLLHASAEILENNFNKIILYFHVYHCVYHYYYTSEEMMNLFEFS